MAKILITGGAGYIGSHTALELLTEGYEVVIYDNLSNSSEESLKRVEELTGKQLKFYEGDVLDESALTAMFKTEKIDAVIHCAALKAVGESVKKPLEYYHSGRLVPVICYVTLSHLKMLLYGHSVIPDLSCSFQVHSHPLFADVWRTSWIILPHYEAVLPEFVFVGVT